MTWISGALIIWALTLAAVDLRVRRVPNVAIAAMVLLVIGAFAGTGTGPLGVGLLESLAGAGLALLLLLPGFLRGALGAGDAKLAGAMGLLLGPLPIALVLLIAAALLGAAALIARLLARREAHLPAAPMLAAGFTAVLSLAAFS